MCKLKVGQLQNVVDESRFWRKQLCACHVEFRRGLVLRCLHTRYVRPSQAHCVVVSLFRRRTLGAIPPVRLGTPTRDAGWGLYYRSPSVVDAF